MGLTKQYLRWIPGEKFGVIASQCQAIQLIHQFQSNSKTNSKSNNNLLDRICATAACEDILLWDLKTCQIIDRISTENIYNELEKNSQISCLSYNLQTNLICSGHYDGTVRLFDCQKNFNISDNLNQNRLKVIFSGHRGFVSCLSFDHNGVRIASGGKDTEIVIWDVVNQSGMFRLKGHKGPINCIQFMKYKPWILISASSDSFIKLWDLNTQHCFKTLVGHRTEVWSFVLLQNDTKIISGGSDSELKVWRIMFAEEEQENFHKKQIELKEKRRKRLELIKTDGLDDQDDISDEETDNFILIENYGTILRKSIERLLNIFVDQTERLLVCHGKDKFVECFKLRNEEEIRQKIKKRLRKERKRRLEQEDGDEQEQEEIDPNLDENHRTVSDEIERLESINSISSSKIRSLDLRMTKFDGFQEFKIVLLLSNNSLESYQLILKPPNQLELKESSRIHTMGHRNDVRTLSISSDCLTIMTGSSDSIKLWNKSSCRCINTIDENLEYPICSLFVPGDKHIVLGTKSGKLQIINLIQAEIQSTIIASDDNKPIRSICLLPDLTGIVSGSEDGLLKFWSFDLVVMNDEDLNNDLNDNDNDNLHQGSSSNNSRILTLNQERYIECEDGILCLKVSPNSKFVAASMLDCCVRIYFCDTFKFFLSLYGHKLPVLCIDISTDNSLIITGSSDKNIKIWGMDFGDCHRSLFAHDDNICSIRFLPKTHQFFTSSKDSQIKLWDADNFEKIQTLQGHFGEIHSMEISSNGKFLITSSNDKSIRIWNKTQEPLILEEEKEIENELEFENEMKNIEMNTIVPGEFINNNNNTINDNDDDNNNNKNKIPNETGIAQRKTIGTIKSVERLIESIDIFLDEIEKLNLYQRQLDSYERKRKQQKADKDQDGETETEISNPPVREPINPNLMIYQTECPYRFILEVFIRIKSNELEETLLQLPYYYIEKLLEIFLKFLEKNWQIELICRSICFLLRTNFGQIQSSSKQMAILIDKLRKLMKTKLLLLENLLGINLAGLKYYQDIFEQREEISIFSQLISDNNNNKKKKSNKSKKSKLNSAPIMTWT